MTDAQAYKGPPAGSGHTEDDVNQRQATVRTVPDPRRPSLGIFSAQDTVLPSQAGPKELRPSGLP